MNCMIEYDMKDIFHLDYLNNNEMFHLHTHQHKKSIEKITIKGKEYDAIIPNRNWCCVAGYSAWKCSENDIIIKVEEPAYHGWIQYSKPIELQKK